MIRPSTRSSGQPLDRTIEQSAVDCLGSSPYQALRAVNCRAQDGVLTLSGRVPSYHMKQMAQTAVMKQPHVKRVVNQLEVAAAAVEHQQT